MSLKFHIEALMSQPLVVTIPHRLGKEEAVRRLKAGFGQLRTSYSAMMSVDNEAWSGDRLDFSIRAVGQTASGAIDVGEDQVRLELQLPWLLAKLADKVMPTLEKQTRLMLEKK